MIPVAAAILTFVLLAGAGIVWAVRRDETRRASGPWIAGSGVDDSGSAIAYAGSSDGAGCGTDGGSADCGGGGG
jgi:hypothetical protein